MMYAYSMLHGYVFMYVCMHVCDAWLNVRQMIDMEDVHVHCLNLISLLSYLCVYNCRVQRIFLYLDGDITGRISGNEFLRFLRQ
jgi:hypothetical protein